MSITYNTEYLRACSTKLGDVVTDPYKTLEAIINTFFNQANINNNIFPEIGEGYCSFYEPHSSSRPTINGKKAVTLKDPEMVKYTNQIKYFVRDTTFKKHIICFTIFLFSSINLTPPAPAEPAPAEPAEPENIKDSLYVYIKNFKKQNPQTEFNPRIRSFAQNIIEYIGEFASNNNSSIKYNFCEYIKNTVKPAKSPEDITKKLEELVQLINLEKFNEIKISDLFRLKSTETGQEYKGLIDHLNNPPNPPPQNPPSPNLEDTKNKLIEYIKTLKIPITIHESGEFKYGANVPFNENLLSTFETLKCTEVREDVLTGIEFKELTINELHTFINYQNRGYCYTYDYIALKMINERSKPKLDIEIPHDILANLLTKYYAYAASTDSLDDFLRAYDEMRSNYTGNILGNLTEITKTDIETLRKPQNQPQNQPQNPPPVPSKFTEIYNVFKYILDPSESGLAKAVEEADITQLCKSSIGTIFDLIGLFGYTLVSDDITVGENDGSKFSIAKNCSLILLDLFEKLGELKDKLTAIKFKYKNLSGNMVDTSIGIILGKMQNTCIHGVGNEAMRYFFLALKVKNRYINSLKEKISKAVLTELKDYGYPGTLETQADQEAAKQFLNDTFIDPPFIKNVPRELTNIGFAYVTCIRQDRIHNFNPLACKYSVMGYTIDGDFSYLCDISSTTTYVKDQNPKSALDFLNKSGNFTITTHSQCRDYNKGEIMTSFLQTHRNYLREMIKISYVFQKNRVPLFKVYKEYVLNICTVMSNKQAAQDQTRAKFLTKLYKKTQYDVINMEDTGFPVKYLTGIVIEDNPEYRGHLYGNTTLIDGKINANANSANANAIQNNPKYYVTTLDNIANLKYVPNPDDNNKAIIKLPETGQDITRPFHYAKLLASMLYPDMYFQECTIRISSNYKVFSEHVQRKWSLFESYYHNVNGQSSQFRQIMFSAFDFIYKYKEPEETKTIRKTKGQFSRMKFKVNGESGVEKLVNAMIEFDSRKNILNPAITKITKGENAEPSPPETVKLISDLEAMFDYFETIDAINAPIILGKILYKFNEIKSYIAQPPAAPAPPAYPELIEYLDDAILSIITGMRFWMAHTIHYFKNVLPSNGYHDKVNTNRWKVEEKFKDYEMEWNVINPEDLVKHENFIIIGRKYYLVLEGVIDIIIQHGYDPSTYQYHFTEIQKELYLIKYLATQLQSDDDLDNANVAQLGYQQQPKFVEIFKKSQNVINEIIPFYNDKEYYKSDLGDDEIFKQSDYQEGIRTRFEYLLKIELVKMHEARMQQYAYFENLLANIYKNFNNDNVIRIVLRTRNLFTNFTSSHGRHMQEIFDLIQDDNLVGNVEEGHENVPADPVPNDPLQAQGLVMLDVQDREIAEALIEIINGILANDFQIGLQLMKAEIQEMIDTNVYDRQKLLNMKARFEMMMNFADDE
jgi:hypothetical protein